MTAFNITAQALFDSFKAADVAKSAAARAAKGSEVDLAAEQLAAAAVEPMRELIRSGLGNVFATHEMVNGSRPAGSEAAVAWDTDLDEAIETWADGVVRAGVGVDGIGEACNALVAADPDTAERWRNDTAAKWAPGVVAAVLKDLTPAKILSAAGLVKRDLPAGVAPAAEEAAPPAPSLSQDVHTVVTAIKSFADMMGMASADEMTAYLTPQIISEQLWSTDDVMRSSAMTRVGAAAAAPALGRIVASGKMTADQLIASVFDQSAVPEAAAPPAGNKPAKPAGGGRKKGRNVPVTRANDLLDLLRTHGGLKDQELADMVGVSRAAMAKMAKGDTGWAPDAADLAPFRELAGRLSAAAVEADAILQEYGA